MAGFPYRSTRSHLGARKVNVHEVQNPAVDLGAGPINLLYDQVAGAAMTAPLLVAAVDPAGNNGNGSFDYLQSLNSGNVGIAVAGAALVWTVTVDHGGIPNEDGAVTTVAEATVDPALSINLVSPLRCTVTLNAPGLANGARAVVTSVTHNTDDSDFVITQSGIVTAVPFTLVVYGRNGVRGGP